MAKLMPPILANDFRRVDLIDGPQMGISIFVQEDGLEDVVFEIDVLWELRLVVRAVETHLEFGLVFGILFDEIHGLE